MIHASSGFPREGMTYDAIQLQQPAAHRELRLFCLLVTSRDGQARTLPVHTLRPMPPRVCPTRSHTKMRLVVGAWTPLLSQWEITPAFICAKHTPNDRLPKYWSVVANIGKPVPFVPLHEPFELVG